MGKGERPVPPGGEGSQQKKIQILRIRRESPEIHPPGGAIQSHGGTVMPEGIAPFFSKNFPGSENIRIRHHGIGIDGLGPPGGRTEEYPQA